MPDEEDGILRSFIDRYTTMLIHDSIYMEELPAPHFMHQSLSILNPLVKGGLKHDPRETEEDMQHHGYRHHEYDGEHDGDLHHDRHHDAYHAEKHHSPSLKELLMEAEMRHDHQERHHS